MEDFIDGVDDAGRQGALFRGDSAAYAEFCEEQGITPEFPDVYESQLCEREIMNAADSARAAVPTFQRRVYAGTEQLGRKIANAFEIADGKLSLVSISGSVEPVGRDDAGESYRFRARVSLGTVPEEYFHPGSLCISHDDRRTLEEDLAEYKVQCLAEITDAIERQSQGRLTVEPSQFVDLAVRRKG